MLKTTAATLLACTMLASQANAQSTTYYAREHLSTPTTVVAPTPTPTPSPTGTPTPTPTAGTWNVGEWSSWSSSCSSSAVRLRSVVCTTGAGPAPDASCAEAKPTSSEVGNLVGCTYDWSAGPWGEWSSTCSATASKTREVTCQRSDGTLQPDTACATTKPDTTAVSNFAGCTFSWDIGEWSNWDSSCSATAKRTRSVVCKRSDGTTAFNGSCNSQPPEEETKPIYTDCGGALVNGNFNSGLNGWSASANTPTVDSTTFHSGPSAIRFKATSSANNPSSISQSVTTYAMPYSLSIWCYSTSGYPLKVYWNGTLIGTCAGGSGNASWSQQGFNVQGSGGTDTVMFMSPNASTLRVDDVVLSPSP